MRNFYLLISTLLLALQSNAQYCIATSTGGCTLNFNVSFSTTGGITNITNNNTNCAGVGGYIYYPGMTHTGVMGSNVNFSFTNNPGWNEYYGIWVDWNQDFDFTDPGELVYGISAVTIGATVNGSFPIPFTATPGLTRLRLRSHFVQATLDPCASNYDGETEDYDLMIIPPTPCAGKPNAGAIVENTAGGKTLTLPYSTNQGDLFYQWQRREFCPGSTWTNIAGATGRNYSLATAILPAYFRCIVTCGNSGVSDTSTEYYVPMQKTSNLTYCTSIPTQTADEEIYRVTVNGASAPAMYLNTSGCSNVAPGPGSALNRYSNFTTLGALTNVMPGQNVTFSINEDECDGATYYSNGIAMWIDFNGDGDFLDPGETVYKDPVTSVGPKTVNGNFTVPLTAVKGLVGLRVISAEGYADASLGPCLSYSFGETEDYLIQIGVRYDMVTTGGGFFCSNTDSTVVLTARAVDPNAPHTFMWVGPNGFVSTDSTLTFPRIGGAAGPSGTYRVYLLSGPCGSTPLEVYDEKQIDVFVQTVPP
ncbi:MAG TPA: GEVED domain-containing protein, partial [Flavipsychrobacter sp.]|nr:GEVED domain-containing protein [Flavipsychrobacter sp.]